MTDLSLPRLQIHLHGLRAEQTLAVPTPQIELLFGHNDMAERRLSRFARSHKCTIAHSDDCVVFQKMARN